MQTPKIISLDNTESTNNYTVALADQGDPQVVVVTARKQSSGKGRMGRSWVSPQGGIYISFLFRPARLLSEVCFFPTICALAVVKLLEKFVAVGVKWPNDVYCNGKKISGILVEAKADSKSVEYVVAGIGININSPAGDLPPTATSLSAVLQKECDIERMTSELITHMMTVYQRFCDEGVDGLLKEAGKYYLQDYQSQIEQLLRTNTIAKETIILR